MPNIQAVKKKSVQAARKEAARIQRDRLTIRFSKNIISVERERTTEKKGI